MADQLASVADFPAADPTAAIVQIEAATAVVQEAAGGQRILQVVNDTVAIPVPSGRWLELPQRPVTAVLSVTLPDGTVVTAGTASGTYRRIGNRLWRNVGWSRLPSFPTSYFDEAYGLCDGPGEIVVVYTHGLADGDQKLQLARAAVQGLAKGPLANPSGASSEQIDDYRVAYERASAAMEASPYLQKALRRQYGKRAAMVRVY